MFPGQGSQKKGMGAALFDEFPELTTKADEILGYSIRSLCLDDADGLLNQTQYTQPALYFVNTLSIEQLQKQNVTKIDYLLGHSLGEYNALQASGAMSFEDGLRLVKKRGELMSQAANGGMLALLKININDIEQILEKYGLHSIDIANYNTPSQTVISGPKNDIEKAKSLFEKEGAYAITLNTSGAFHSRYMENAKIEFAHYIKSFSFHQPKIPVISNVYARPYKQEEIAQTLAEQITHPVRWTESIQYLLYQGELEFKELGDNSTILSKMISEIKKEFKSAKVVELKQRKSQDHHTTDGTPNSSGKMLRENELKTIEQEIHNWNKKYPIGTKIKVDGYEEVMKTRSEAVMLFGFRSAIYLEGFNGYFPLKKVRVLDQGVSV